MKASNNTRSNNALKNRLKSTDGLTLSAQHHVKKRPAKMPAAIGFV
jgi:hypothetical protein